MSGPEQVLYLVVVPAAIVAVVWALASVGGPQSRRRYRPGRPYEFAPVWYVANHRPGSEPAGTARAALTAGPTGTSDGTGMPGATGGASDRW